MYQTQQAISARRDLSRPSDRQGKSPRKTTTCGGLAERPVTPTSSNYATEAHIHRIRNASLHSNYKLMCNVRSLVPTSKRTSQENDFVWPGPPEDEEYADDVESVDWTEPLKNVHKSEYAISRQNERQYAKLGVTKSAIVADVVEFPPTTNATQICSELPLPEENGEDLKRRLLEKYVRISKSKPSICRVKPPEGTRLPYPDYNLFVRGLNQEIARIKAELMRWDFNPLRPRKNPKQVQKESFERAYETIKKMYELNPQLTESAAKKVIGGPPGNHWMGLSRMQVVQAMEKIREGKGLAPQNFANFGDNALRPYARIMQEITQKKNPKKKSKSTSKMLNRKTPREKKLRKKCTTPRPAKVPTQHVPGPAHLHTNICIRPWEPSMDGWSQGEEIKEDIEKYHINNNLATYKRPAFTRLPSISPTRPNSPQQSRSPNTSQSPLLSTYEYEQQKNTYAAEEDNDKKDRQKEDFITLEIFNPIYQIHR